MRDIEQQHIDKLKKWAEEIREEIEEADNDALVAAIEARTGVKDFAGDVDPPPVFAYHQAYESIIFQLLQNACEVRVETPTAEEIKEAFGASDDDQFSEADDIPDEVFYRIRELGWILGPSHKISLMRDWEGILVGLITPRNDKVDGVYLYDDGRVAHTGLNLPPTYDTFEEMFEADEEFAQASAEASHVREAPTLALVAEQAERINGWESLAIVESEGRPGSGHIAFQRDRAPFEGKRCGTAFWVEAGGEVHFEHGHYDLSRAEALADLSNRSGLTSNTILNNVTAALGG
jgi:hypothetical protein